MLHKSALKARAKYWVIVASNGRQLRLSDFTIAVSFCTLTVLLVLLLSANVALKSMSVKMDELTRLNTELVHSKVTIYEAYEKQLNKNTELEKSLNAVESSFKNLKKKVGN